MRAPKCIPFLVSFLLMCITSGCQDKHSQNPVAVAPIIPKTWDDNAMATLELPLANPVGSPKHVPAEYYYRIPVRPIYKTYPKIPPGSRAARLSGVAADGSSRSCSGTIADVGRSWSPKRTGSRRVKWSSTRQSCSRAHTANAGQMRAFIAKTGDLYDKDGVSPVHLLTSVIANRAKLETGEVACAECHTRVMADGTVIKGAQGNRPIEQVTFYELIGRRKSTARDDFSPRSDRPSRARSPRPGCDRILTSRSADSRPPKSKRCILRQFRQAYISRAPGQQLRSRPGSRPHRRQRSPLPRSHRLAAANLTRRYDALRRAQSGW